MSKKYRVLVEASPVAAENNHAFIVLQYADENGKFATDPYNDYNDKDAIIYRSGAASPLSCL